MKKIIVILILTIFSYVNPTAQAATVYAGDWILINASGAQASLSLPGWNCIGGSSGHATSSVPIVTTTGEATGLTFSASNWGRNTQSGGGLTGDALVNAAAMTGVSEDSWNTATQTFYYAISPGHFIQIDGFAVGTVIELYLYTEVHSGASSTPRGCVTVDNAGIYTMLPLRKSDQSPLKFTITIGESGSAKAEFQRPIDADPSASTVTNPLINAIAVKVVSVPSVPEPSTTVLALLGLGSLALRRSRSLLS